MENAPDAKERVLSTLNRDGTRRWLRPKLSPGQFHRYRKWVAWSLIFIFTATPYVKIGGEPLLLLDIIHRKFVIFGRTFLATDTFLLMLLAVSTLVGIFLITAIFGHVWCGWACPQTVYMEFVFRPLERLFEGNPGQQRKIDERGGSPRRMAKKLVYLLVAAFLAHTFLSYFVGVEQLFQWVQSSPADHPIAFAVMIIVTGAMFFDFGYFREQTCLVACPYGRFQSALLDRDSLIVGYDRRRGEPRGKGRRGAKSGATGSSAALGDCVDCGKCVTTCPTGIDIRDGLQMECIGCTQCIDACDDVMDKLDMPRGLIRYSSQNELTGAPRRVLRPRVVIYPLILLVFASTLAWQVLSASTTDVTVLRAPGATFQQIPSGEISNSVLVKIVNRSQEVVTYEVTLTGLPDARLLSAELPLVLQPGERKSLSLFIMAPPGGFQDGRRPVTLNVRGSDGYESEHTHLLIGPH